VARLTDSSDERVEGAKHSAPAAADVDAVEARYEPNSDQSLRWLFIGLALVSVLVGVFAYWRYANSESWVVEGIKHMDEVGAELSDEQCIDEVVTWYDACDQHGANAAVCLQGVGILMHHCLSARPRDQVCELYLDADSSVRQPTEDMRARARNPEKAGESGRWVYARCEARDMVCRSKRECACAEAYRAIDSFCRTGQQAVQL